jgi:hypothetical protein
MTNDEMNTAGVPASARGCFASVILALLLTLTVVTGARAAPQNPDTGAGSWTGCRQVSSVWVRTPIWPIVRR